MTPRALAVPVGTCVLLSACAQPLGPTVQVMPGQGHSFEAFQANQRVCSLAADAQTKPMVDRASAMQLGTAVIGTALGAGLGAAADQGNAYTGPIQGIYDNTYAACMASHGDQVVHPAAPSVVIQQAPVLVQPAPYYVQPTPYVVLPAPPAQP